MRFLKNVSDGDNPPLGMARYRRPLIDQMKGRPPSQSNSAVPDKGSDLVHCLFSTGNTSR